MTQEEEEEERGGTRRVRVYTPTLCAALINLYPARVINAVKLLSAEETLSCASVGTN